MPDFSSCCIVDVYSQNGLGKGEPFGSGAIAQKNSTAWGQQAAKVDGDFSGGNLNTGIQIDTQINITSSLAKSLPFPKALQHYLDSVIATHQLLRLQGIRAGSQLLSVALEKVYVSLTAVDMRPSRSDADKGGDFRDSGILTIVDALNRYRCLVIMGDPGCGKNTLLSYIALTYACSLRA